MADQFHPRPPACVAHIVKLSLLGADLSAASRFQRAHRQAELALEESGIAWTHLRPNFFMQTLTQYLQGEALISIGGDGPLSAVDMLDVTSVAAAALTEPGHARRAYELTGPQALTRAEMAETFSAALGRTVQWVDLPVEQAKRRLARRLAILCRAEAEGPENESAPTWRSTGKKKLSRNWASSSRRTIPGGSSFSIRWTIPSAASPGSRRC